MHIDNCDPFPTLFIQKHSFFLVILEDDSNFGHVGFLQKQNDGFGFYCETEAYIELTTGMQIYTVCIDGAAKLCEEEMGRHICGHGITLQITAPYAYP